MALKATVDRNLIFHSLSASEVGEESREEKVMCQGTEASDVLDCFASYRRVPGVKLQARRGRVKGQAQIMKETETTETS